MNELFKYRNRILTVVYLMYLFILTLSPFHFSMKHLHEFSDKNIVDLIYAFIYINSGDIIANLLLFLPLGFLFYYSFQKDPEIKILFKAMIIGGMLSFIIEFLQLFLDRSTNITDIAMNAIGSGAGFIIAILWQRNHSKIPKISKKIIRNTHFFVLMLYSVFVIMICLLPRRYTSTKWWNPDYPLLIGNEGTSDRPWRGDVYFIALFQKALRAREAHALYLSILDSNSVNCRQSMGLIAAYPLTEGQGDTIHDTSTDSDQISLTGNALQWISGRGIRSLGELIHSITPSNKITDAVKQSQEFSVEIWCRPENLIQGGPARIISLSPDVSKRNFCLAQESDELHFRFRTYIAGSNGSQVNLRAANVLNSITKYHFIATFSHGVEQLYVNGKRHPDVIFGHITYLPILAGLGGGQFAQIGFIWGLMFPLGVLAITYFKKRHHLISVLYPICVAVGIDLYYIISYGAPVCLIWIATTIGTSFLSLLFVVAVSKP